jgi:NAD(P)-dependent dehydrogenase (short-subunit alcohol dehydrogenase family)
MKLDKSVAAIVTGGASGLGEATARMLASQGVKVAIFDMNAERGEQVARETGMTFCPRTSPTRIPWMRPWPKPARPMGSSASS